MNLSSIGVARQDINILLSPKAFKEQLLSLIASAQQRIYVTALYLQNDEAGREILTALYQAKQINPELDICLFVDAHRAQRGLIGEAAQLGNKALYLDYANTYQHNIHIFGVAVKSKELLGVLHLKGIIVDDVVLYTGASINNVYLYQQDKYRLDRYYQIKTKTLADSFCQYLDDNFVHSTAAVCLTDEATLTKKEQKLKSKRTKSIVQRAQYSFETSEKSLDIQLIPLVGCGKRKNQLNIQICDLIKQSKETIVLFTPYFNLPRAITSQIVAALKRGVKVTVIVGDKTASDFFIADQDKFSTIGIIPYIYEQILQRFIKRWQKMLEAGQLNIKLWKDENNSYHLKGLVVDETQHLLTGSNLNPRAWGLDLENGILVQDPKKQLLEGFKEELSVICKHTQDIRHYQQLDALKDYPIKPRKLLARLTLSKIDRLLKRFL